MSGFVGLVNCNGTPVDQDLLQRMTQFLSLRGPDAQDIWAQGPVGLGHALLRTTLESQREHQPFSPDRQIWIVAQARLDGRQELIRELQPHNRRCSDSDPDVALVAHAYLVWGTDCVNHLLGDFSFAIWDGKTRSLFCARDPLGVKPFYYSLVSDGLVFSNTLDCVRMHYGVTDRLNDFAIADFLLIGHNEAQETTTFADIQRLPPAHTFTWSERKLQLRRYLEMPIEEPLHYRRSADYVDQFRELLNKAVSDRLRTPRVSVYMSGGLDSTTVAATANLLLKQEPGESKVCGFTLVQELLAGDREHYFAGLVAQHCGFPIRYIVCDRGPLFAACDRPEMFSPEPSATALASIFAERDCKAAAYSRVVLTGEGGDPGLTPSLAYFRGFRGISLPWKVAQYALKHRRLPRLGFRISYDRWRGARRPFTPYPAWLAPAFEKRCAIRERWETINQERPRIHQYRPDAHGILTMPAWTASFESFDAGVVRMALEARHPLCDLRLQRYLLRVPVLPWCADKELIRVAMRGTLPAKILQRPKTPLAYDPMVKLIAHAEHQWIDQFTPEPELDRYVVRERVPPLVGRTIPGSLEVDLRPIALNFWLKYAYPLEYRCRVTPRGAEQTRAARH